MKLLKCTCYLSFISAAGFLAGRLMPRKLLKPEEGLFRCFPFEKNGTVYEKLGIRKWHKQVPDMSRILPFMMPAKNLSGDYADRLPEMIRETCVAELVHLVMCVLSLFCLRLWPGAGGITVTAIYILLLNVPFIMIQRYNRPRLIRLRQELLSREQAKQALQGS